MEPCVFQSYILQNTMNKTNKFYLIFMIIYLQEREDEKWRPIISVEAILLSVQNMLSDPNEYSPANIDAAVILYFSMLGCDLQRQWKSDKKAFRKRVRETVNLSLEDQRIVVCLLHF